MAGPVHYEVYIRKTAPAPWALEVATEDRARAIQMAEDLLADSRAAAVRVTKETLDPDTMEFNSVTVLTRGAPEVKRKRVVAGEDVGARAVLDVADVDPGTKVLRVTRARAAGAAQVRAVPPPVA